MKPMRPQTSAISSATARRLTASPDHAGPKSTTGTSVKASLRAVGSIGGSFAGRDGRDHDLRTQTLRRIARPEKHGAASILAAGQLAAALGGRDQRRDMRPFIVGQITGVS